MNQLRNFDFQGKKVRTVQISNEPYFVGKDVAEILGYQNGSRDINRHVDEEDRQNYQNGTFESPRGLTVINESGLYSLILSSKMPNAKQFKHWVTSEVLPSIRKHGAYMTPETIEKALLNPDTIIQLATNLKSERQKRLIAEQQVNELTPKATYYDKVLSNPALVTISIIAKDYGMSGKAMNTKLHELGVQYRQGKVWLLYSKYQKLGWTHSETHMVPKKDGTEKAVVNTKWTQKGRLGLYELLKEKDILPIIEQKVA